MSIGNGRHVRTGTLLAAFVGLCLPASALGAHAAGVVLTADRHGHVLQVIGRRHTVSAYHYHGSMSGLRAGSRIRFRDTGQKITHLTRRRKLARELMFVATVVRMNSHVVVVRLTDGKTISLRSARIRGGSVTSGSAVQVTETLGRRVIVTITAGRRGGLQSSAASSTGPLQVTGTVVEIDTTSFVVAPDKGSSLRFQISPGDLYSLQMSLCNVATVGYTPSNMTVTANDVNFADKDSTAGSCSDPGPPNLTGTADAIGPITQLTLSAVTVATATGPMTFAATINLTGGYLVGDTVDVSYLQDSGGNLVASDLNADDHDAVGRVTAVSAGSLTIINTQTGHITTFTDDPSNGTFDGVSVGENVDVAFYYSNGNVVVDYITNTGIV
jgi:hypothetical protein